MATLRIVTWNLNGLEPRTLDQRTEAACLALLMRDPPDVVLLQEVVRRSWHGHIKHHFHHGGFRAIPPDPTTTTSEYFCVVMVRADLPLTRATLSGLPNTHMGRALLAVHANWEGRDLLLLTAHLESGKAASRIRKEQLTHIVHAMLHHDGPAVFGGDTNLRKAEEPDVDGLDRVIDAWQAAGAPSHDRATWPSIPSGRPGARFDRILGHRITMSGFSVRGRAIVAGLDEPPSDHLALQITIEASAPR